MEGEEPLYFASMLQIIRVKQQIHLTILKNLYQTHHLETCFKPYVINIEPLLYTTVLLMSKIFSELPTRKLLKTKL